MSAFEHRAMKTVATSVVAAALLTVSALSAMAAPSNKTVARTKAAVHAHTVKKAAGVKKGIGSKAAIDAKRSAGVRKLAVHKAGTKAAILRPTVLPEIVIDNAPAETVAAASPTFRKHFFRGQA